jgi:short-subunit dehydrogenase
MELRDCTILITGASRGIGAALARALADYPVRLALLARSDDALQALAAELNGRGPARALPVVADVGLPETINAAVARVESTLGPVDVLVNNAGVGMAGPVGRLDHAAAHRVFAVNYWGALHCIEAVLPGMRQRRNGLIVNVSSIIGRRAMPHTGVYCASKFALNALSESLRLEVRPDNVRVVTFYPGVTATDFGRHELTGTAARYNRNRVPKTPVTRTAQALVRAIRQEPRDAYVTLFDRAFVWSAILAPGLMDRLLARFYRPIGDNR